MGSSRSEYYRSTITWQDLERSAKEMAWKKTGFENAAALKDFVRELPLEERLDLLTEYLIDDLSKIYLKRRLDFMEALGQRICVSKEEILEYAERVYPNFEIDTMWIEDHYICPDELSMRPYRKKR